MKKKLYFVNTIAKIYKVSKGTQNYEDASDDLSHWTETKHACVTHPFSLPRECEEQLQSLSDGKMGLTQSEIGFVKDFVNKKGNMQLWWLPKQIM